VDIVQEAANAARTASALCRSGNLFGDETQMDRTAEEDAGHHPGKIADSRFVVHGKHVPNVFFKSMIGLYDGHCDLLFWLVLVNLTLTGYMAIVSFKKMSGN
jgi:hypothetical protein